MARFPSVNISHLGEKPSRAPGPRRSPARDPDINFGIGRVAGQPLPLPPRRAQRTTIVGKQIVCAPKVSEHSGLPFFFESISLVA
jgi:hypothetical protein